MGFNSELLSGAGVGVSVTVDGMSPERRYEGPPESMRAKIIMTKMTTIYMVLAPR